MSKQGTVECVQQLWTDSATPGRPEPKPCDHTHAGPRWSRCWDSGPEGGNSPSQSDSTVLRQVHTSPSHAGQ